MLKHRSVRVLLPLILGILLINPLLQYLWLIGDLDALRFVMPGQEIPEIPSDSFVYDHFSTGRFARYLFPHYLWFLYFLCFFYALMIPILLVGKSSPGRWIVDRLTNLQRYILQRTWLIPGLFLILLPCLWQMDKWAVDTPNGWLPSLHLLGYYFLFFSFGWILFAQRELLPVASKHWRIYLLVAHFLVFPLYLACVLTGLDQMKLAQTDTSEFLGTKLLAQITGGIFTWLMIFGLMGLFHYLFSKPNRYVRYLADSSYWCYVGSLVPLIVLQMLMARVDWPLAVKVFVVHAGALAFLLFTYEYFVRYTAIGALLNGPKKRISSSPEPQRELR